MAEVFAPDNLFAGSTPESLSGHATIKAASGVLQRGTVLGKIALAIAAPLAEAGNTGNGICAGQALGMGAKKGAYAITCITAHDADPATAAVFMVLDPEGYRLADATEGVAYAGPIAFTITPGVATGFAVGDAFTITVGAGSGQYVIVNSDNRDGSQRPEAILAQTIDATAAKLACTYVQGCYNEGALIFGGADTADTHRDTLQARNIILRPVLG
ncbi:MAG TPA: head decoration protein [Armatimonadota bacterium]|jgi:hypothetical protein